MTKGEESLWLKFFYLVEKHDLEDALLMLLVIEKFQEVYREEE
jgi:hypothetical protein